MDTSDVVDRILSAWRVADKRAHVADFPCGVPDKGDILTLFDTAFYASIQKEEGQFVTFSLMFLQSHKETKPRHLLSEFNSFLPFSDPTELSVEAVRKLAGAVDERTSSLIVEKRDKRLVISGIAPFGRAQTLLSAAGGGYPRPEALTLSVRAPGAVLISRESSSLGRFTAGEFTPAQPTPLRSAALGGTIIDRISEHEAHARYQMQYNSWYFDALRHLLRSASGRGHGGSIIWVPEALVSQALELTRLGTHLGRFDDPNEAMLDLVGCSATLDKLQGDVLGQAVRVPADSAKRAIGYSMYKPQVKSKLTTLLNALAQIACVDGALLISDMFRPLVFGARLSASPWPGKVHLATNATPEEVPRGRYGTRHNSAIDFIGACPGAIAFVLSQDGPVRAFERRGDAIVMWPDCLDTMSVE